MAPPEIQRSPDATGDCDSMIMFELSLMASNGYPSVLVSHHHLNPSMAIKDCQAFLSICGARRETSIGSGLRNVQVQQIDEPWKSFIGFPESNQLVEVDLKVRGLKMVDAQDNRSDSLISSSRFDEEFKRYKKALEFLVPCSSEENKHSVDLSDLRGLQEIKTQHQGLFASSLIFPGREFDAHQPVMDFVGELIKSSKITIHPDGQILFTETGAEIKDLLSIVAEFYVSNNSLSWRKQSILVPSSVRLNNGVGSHVYDDPFVKLHATTVAPIKSPDTVKAKPSPKRRTSKKIGRERDLYKRNYFHACESLLSYMFNKQQHGKTAILSLKNSGRELSELLTQFSAGIAGTGLVVLLSVMYKVACGSAPFCSSKLLNIGFGFGLVWLSCAVNKLRDTVICISKKAGKVGLKEDEMMRRVDTSVNSIFFRAATLMTVAILRIG